MLDPAHFTRVIVYGFEGCLKVTAVTILNELLQKDITSRPYLVLFWPVRGSKNQKGETPPILKIPEPRPYLIDYS